MSRAGGLYVLADPVTHEIRYVGQTNNFARRRADYRRGLKPHDQRRPVARWILGLSRHQLAPVFIPVLAVADPQQRNAAEVGWIDNFRRRGSRLLNVEDGGIVAPRAPRAPWTEERRRKALGKPPWNKGQQMSPESRQRMRLAKLGRKQAPEAVFRRAAKLRGHAVSAETRRKLSAKFAGRPISTEQRRQIAETLRGRPLSAATREKLCVAQAARRLRERAERLEDKDG